MDRVGSFAGHARGDRLIVQQYRRFARVNEGKDLSPDSLLQNWNADLNRSMVRPFLKESLVLSVHVKQERDQGLTSIGLLVSVVAQHVRQWRDHSAGLMA